MNEFVKMNGDCVDVAVFYWLEDGRHSQGLHVLKLGGEIAAHCWVSFLTFLLIVLPVSSSSFSRTPYSFCLIREYNWPPPFLPWISSIFFSEKKKRNRPIAHRFYSPFFLHFSPLLKIIRKNDTQNPPFILSFFSFFLFLILR